MRSSTIDRHMKLQPIFVLFLLVACCTCHSVVAAVAPSTNEDKPLKIFLLAGQSNMVGMGSLDHLKLLVNGTSDQDDYCPCEYQTLWDKEKSDFRQRNDVYMQYNDKRGKLTAGTGFAAPDHFGPELGFGWVLGDALENETILLIKSAYGGRNLAVDFRPPASGEGNYSGVKPSTYGWEYRQMILDFETALNNITRIYPDYKEEMGFELSGLVWFQGWNDMLSWDCVHEYAWNLENLIRDVRLDLDAQNLPVIIGELGMHGLNPTGRGSDRVMAMRHAEKNVTFMPEFLNTTLYIRTAQYVVSNGTTYNGNYHYYGRADTYYHIGNAFGRGMLRLLHAATKRHSSSPLHYDDGDDGHSMLDVNQKKFYLRAPYSFFRRG